MIMYRVVEQLFSGLALQEKEIVRVTDKTVTYIHSVRGEVRESKRNRSTKWFEEYEDAKDFAIKSLKGQIKIHSRNLERSQAKLDEFLGGNK